MGLSEELVQEPTTLADPKVLRGQDRALLRLDRVLHQGAHRARHRRSSLLSIRLSHDPLIA